MRRQHCHDPRTRAASAADFTGEIELDRAIVELVTAIAGRLKNLKESGLHELFDNVGRNGAPRLDIRRPLTQRRNHIARGSNQSGRYFGLGIVRAGLGRIRRPCCHGCFLSQVSFLDTQAQRGH
jgi:hypothetical protein